MEDEILEVILDRILPQASHLTTGQLRDALKRLVLELAPETVKAQLQAGLEDRIVAQPLYSLGDILYEAGKALPPGQHG